MVRDGIERFVGLPPLEWLEREVMGGQGPREYRSGKIEALLGILLELLEPTFPCSRTGNKIEVRFQVSIN